MNQIPDDLRKPFFELLLSVADDKFILGHRNADWTGLAPMLEEDIAFSSLAQDEIAHASALYQMLAGIIGTTADKLAYGRRPNEYRCAEIVTVSDEFDWATALGRKFFCDHFDAVRLALLARSSYTPLSQLAARLVMEEKIHVEHVDSWMIRLGKGGNDACQRMQKALDRMAPLGAGLFEPTEGLDRLIAAEVLPSGYSRSFRDWSDRVSRVAHQAGFRLEVPQPPSGHGGRHGQHRSDFVQLLEELTEVYRLEPEAAW